MGKRIIALMMAMILSVFSVRMTAFAENEGTTDDKVYGDAIITATIENMDCQQLGELEDAEITAVIGLANRPDFIPLEIPVEAIAVEMEDGEEEADLTFWLGYKEKAIEKAFLDYLSDIQGDVFAEYEENEEFDGAMSEIEEDAEDILDEASALLNEITIDFKGMPEHYKVDMEMSTCTIVTNEIVKAIVEMIEELIAMIFPDINMEEIDGFKGLINMILEQEESSLDELLAEIEVEDPEMAAQIRELFDELDSVLAYMQSDEFPGLLLVGVSLSCDCPVKDYYEIMHEYYKNVDGELVWVDSTFEEYEVYTGTVVKAEDYVKCNYNGVEYEYMGSYNLDVIFEDVYYEYDWSEYTLEEFIVGDEDVWGLILRYEIVEENAPVDTEDDTDDIKDTKEEADDTTEESGKAPATGDSADMGFYLVVFAGALGVIVQKKRKIKA